MKTLILLTVLMLAQPISTMAAKGNAWVGFGGGVSLPTDEFAQVLGNGWAAGVEVTYFESRQVGLGASVILHQWSGSIDLGPFLGSVWRVRTSAIQMTPQVVFLLRTAGRVRPYAKGGAGVYWLASDLLKPGISLAGDWDPYFGYHAGIGIHLDGTPSGLSIESTYHVIQASGPDPTVLTVEVSLSWDCGRK